MIIDLLRKLSIAQPAHIKVIYLCESVWILELWCHIDAIMRCVYLFRTK